ncbi:MAG: amidohydrolase [Porphyromonadaceae bacterium]|jgi:hippurate hydrolase|nr:amidohydrolase [Porphyromonadaceae bacterium]
MLQRIKDLSESVFPYVRDCYRHLHANPELSFQEYQTSEFVQKELTAMQIPFRAGIADTGILGIIKGKNPAKRVIALRADMDALPIQEAVDIPWKSKNDGVMHACGHDVHTSCLLGAAKILNQLKNEFEGTILLIFQPGEEKAPGGANLMLKDGIFDEYTPEIIIGQHVAEDYPAGTIALLEGTVMASADEIYLTIKGNGGHGAKPHLCNDTVLAASEVLVSLQQVRSRLCDPLTPMVLTFGRFIADGAPNVIPNEVKLSGTFRTYDEKWRIEAKEHIRRIAVETAAAYGCTVEIEMPDGFPNVINDPKLTKEIRGFVNEFLGEDKVLDFEQRMTGEDFGFFSHLFPSCFYRLGVQGDRVSGNLHSPTFCIEEKSLVTGAGGMAWIAIRCLEKNE